MKKIIAVWGKSNTGKSTAITSWLESQGLRSTGRIDTTVAIPFEWLGKPCVLGVASEGDTHEIVAENLSFCRHAGCSLVICATRTSGGSVEAVKEAANDLNASIEWVEADKHKSLKAVCREVAEQIDQHLASY